MWTATSILENKKKNKKILIPKNHKNYHINNKCSDNDINHDNDKTEVVIIMIFTIIRIIIITIIIIIIIITIIIITIIIIVMIIVIITMIIVTMIIVVMRMIIVTIIMIKIKTIEITKKYYHYYIIMWAIEMIGMK